MSRITIDDIRIQVEEINSKMQLCMDSRKNEVRTGHSQMLNISKADRPEIKEYFQRKLDRLRY